jgi:hypothetical protein
MQIFVDGAQYADFPGATALPSGTQIVLPSSGTHRVAVQTYDNTKAMWVKSTIYNIIMAQDKPKPNPYTPIKPNITSSDAPPLSGKVVSA